MRDVSHMRMGEMFRPPLTEAIQTLLDCFSGADGGGSYANLCRLCLDLDAQAIEGDKKATEILDNVIRTARLVGVANKPR